MSNNSPIRILHFSDFHLNGEKIDDAKHVLTYMLKSLEEINSEKSIDLIIFTGDMMEQGGVGYGNDLKIGFKAFENEVISPLLSTLGLTKERFIFTPGNHDVNRNADKKSLDEYCINHSESAEKIVDLIKDEELSDLKKFDEFKSFEKEYYDSCTDIVYGGNKFTATFEIDINGYSVGISSLNSIWQCGKVQGAPVMGISQITEHTQHLKDKDIKIAISHFPYYKLEKEWQEIERLLSKEFDMFFSGHTHAGLNRFIGATNKDYFLDINTEGTLAANTYENDEKYKNAFQIIDYYPQEKYQIKRYFQIHSQEFDIDRNDRFAPNGVLEFDIPKNSDELERVYNETLKEHIEQKAYIFKSKIHPFVPFKDFIERADNKVMEGDFIPIARFTQIKEKLVNGAEQSIRLMALPGMGKTRIVAEAFREKNDNVYYSQTSNCENGLLFLLSQIQTPILIIDNCEIEQLRKVVKVVSEFGNNARIISIYNIPTNDEKGNRLGLYELGYEDTKPIVAAMIEREPTINNNENIKESIMSYSGNIPLMAKLLIEAYKKTKTLNIEDPDSALDHFIKGSEIQNQYKIETLRAISLFEPLGYENGIKDEFEFVLNNEKIHRINNNHEIIRTAFINTIEDFENRELIEHAGGCIRIRPIPLAEWLASKWIQQNESRFSDVFRQIQQQPKELRNRLADALKRRFEGMIYNSQAKQLFDMINDSNRGSFHDESIAFSETGSRLFLSMGTVSPVSVSKNICGLLEKHKHDINWIKENVSDAIRRNMVYALERMAVDPEAFPYVAKSLLLLASAENETYSNNSTGIFSQLFQCFLSGTRAPLLTRIKVLENAKDKSEYFPIIIKAIDAAFKSRDFMRVESTGKIPKSTEPIDYYPQFSEISEYWNKCAELLLYISKQVPEHDETIKKVINLHVSDIYSWNKGDILDLLLNYFGDKCNYEWPEIRKALNYYIKHWSENDETNKQKALKWYNRFSPKSYLIRVKDAIDNRYVEGRKDYNQFYNDMYELMDPFAKEFVEKKIYQTDEMSLILKDWEFQSHWLIQRIINVLENQYELIKDILNSITSIVKKEATTFESPFITQFCFDIIRDEDEKKTIILKGFQKELYDNDYCRLSASIEGIIDNQQHILLENIIKSVRSGKYDNYCINNYLHRYRWQNINNVLSITDALIKGGIDKEEVVFPYFTNYLLFNDLKDIDHSKLERIEDVLLSYSFKGRSYNTAHQVVELIKYILKTHNRPIFALNVHNKIVEVLSSREIVIDNPFDSMYDVLLPRYQGAILDKLCDDIAAEDNRLLYYWKIHHSLGSGFGYGVGPLFKCDLDLLKKACLIHPETLPSRLAQICPVEEPEKDPTETFFWWLCDNFGVQERMLSEFGCNIGTFSFVGGPNNSLADFISQKEKILIPYTKHPNKTVQDWAKKQIESIRKEVKFERDNEEYRKMILDS